MQRLKNGGVRLEYHDYDNGVYLYKDITPEIAKTFTTRTKVLVDNLPILTEAKLRNANISNDVAYCRTFGTNGCVVEITQYVFNHGKGYDKILYPQFIYY
jgi:hypothetical protein